MNVSIQFVTVLLMARCTKEEALKTRGRILDAAEQVFYEKGVSHTSLADVAQAAGVTRGAIYWHFDNKGDLFNAMIERVALPLDELKAASTDPDETDPLGRIRDLCVLCLRNTATDTHRHRVFDILFLKCEFIEDMEPMTARHRATLREGLAQLEKALRNAISRGQLPADLNPVHAARMVHAMIGGLLRGAALLPDLFDAAANADKVVDAVLDALRFSPALRSGGQTHEPKPAHERRNLSRALPHDLTATMKRR